MQSRQFIILPVPSEPQSLVANWKSQVLDQLTKVYSKELDLMTGLERMQSIVDTETAKKLADD